MRPVPPTRRILIILSLVFISHFLSSHAMAVEPSPLDANVQDLFQKGEYQKAVEQLQKAYNLFPLNPAIRENLIVAYGLLGRRQLESKQFTEAAASFERARELAPDNAEFWLGRGIALYGGKHYDEARFDLEQARVFGGENVTILFFLGKVAYDTGNLEDALDFWKKGLAIDPGNAEIARLVEKTGKEAAVEGKMGKEASSRFDISFDVKSRIRLADEILDVLETAYSRVGSDFDHYPEARVPVIIYTQKDFRSTTGGPDWSGGVYDGKIRLPIGGVKEITPPLRALLHHEYTHVVVREMARGNCPTWLNEGLAQFEERKEAEFPMTELQDAARQGVLLPMATLEGPFTSLGTQGALLAYRQSYAMVSHLISLYGWHKIREILVNLGKRMTMAEAVNKALKDYGIGYQEMLEELQGYLKKEYGGG
jgi:tetratricopeptide (TPR) repeat protein